MPVATFTLELKSPARRNGTHALRIRISKERKHAYWNLGKYILKGELNPTPKPKLKNWVIKSDDAPQINAAIDKALKGLEKISDDNPALTAAGIKEAYQLELNPELAATQEYRNFFEFADEYLLRLKAVNFGTSKTFGKHLKEFKAFAGENTPPATLFSPATLHRFAAYLKAKPNAPKTVQTKLVTLRTFYNRGRKEDALPDLGSPFAQVKVSVPKKKKQRPTAAQVQAFLNHQPQTPEQQFAKTVTMLQYLLQGARISEALKLKWENVHEKYVEYLPAKNARKPKFVPRSGMLNKLLAEQPRTGPYVIDWITETHAKNPARLHHRIDRAITVIGKALKEMAAALEINIPLSSHMFRHAFADALIAAGANPHTAAALLGHSDARTSEAYFKDLQLEDVSELALSIMDKLTGELSGEQ